MGIPPEVLDHTVGILKRWFAICNPFDLVEWVQEVLKIKAISQMFLLSIESEFVFAVSLFKIIKKLASEFMVY